MNIHFMHLAKPVALVVLAAFLAIGAQAQQLTPGTPVTLTEEQKDQVKAYVKDELKDPDSARFGVMAASSRANGVVTVCGWVNARNSYGGYAGEQPFYGIFTFNSVFIVGNVAGDQYEAYGIIKMCESLGIRI